MTREQLIRRIKAEVKKEGSQKALAVKVGVSQSFMSEILKGTREPGPTVLAYFGLSEKVEYQKADAGKR